jgi:hypothetical protein
MRLLVLNSSEQLSSFTKLVFLTMKCDGYFFNEDGGQVVNYFEGEMYKYGCILPVGTSLIILDVFLTPTIILLKKYRYCDFTYVQHGLFSDLTIEKRNKKIKLNWFLRSIKIACRFLSVFGYSYSNITLLLGIMKNGPWSQRSHLAKFGLRINKGVFWNALDLKSIESNFPGFIKEDVVTLPPDFDKLKLEYNEGSPAVYISQPLVEDGIVTVEEYQKFIMRLYDRYGSDVLVIKHPRQKCNFNNQVFLVDVHGALIVGSVIGHFSSLLLSVSNTIPIRYESLGYSSITSYSAYIEQSRRSLDDEMVSFEKVLENV